MYLPLVLLEASESAWIQSVKLYMIMTKLLQYANCQGILDQLVSTLTPNDGVSILMQARDAILPCTTSQILDVLPDTVERLGASLHISAVLNLILSVI